MCVSCMQSTSMPCARMIVFSSSIFVGTSKDKPSTFQVAILPIAAGRRKDLIVVKPLPDLAAINIGALVSFAASVCLPVDSPSLGTAGRELSSTVLTEICVYNGCWPPDVAVGFTLGVADGTRTTPEGETLMRRRIP